MDAVPWRTPLLRPALLALVCWVFVCCLGDICSVSLLPAGFHQPVCPGGRSCEDTALLHGFIFNWLSLITRCESLDSIPALVFIVWLLGRLNASHVCYCLNYFHRLTFQPICCWLLSFCVLLILFSFVLVAKSCGGPGVSPLLPSFLLPSLLSVRVHVFCLWASQSTGLIYFFHFRPKSGRWLISTTIQAEWGRQKLTPLNSLQSPQHPVD